MAEMKSGQVDGARHVAERQFGAQVASHDHHNLLHSHVQDETSFPAKREKSFAVQR
jgi:hypothetical protein